jgi:hypothetical protein
MPINKNALIRYKVLDNCFRNRQRKWTLDLLVDKVSDALYEYEGISKGASVRTIQYDIQICETCFTEVLDFIKDKRRKVLEPFNFPHEKDPLEGRCYFPS